MKFRSAAPQQLATVMTWTAVTSIDIASGGSSIVAMSGTVAQCLLGVGLLATLARHASKHRFRGRSALPLIIGRVTVALLLLLFLYQKLFVLLSHDGEGAGASIAPYRIYSLGVYACAMIGLALHAIPDKAIFQLSEYPARVTASSFAAAALLGALLLNLPQALRDLSSASFIDGLFMATSAICVTGLVVRDVPRTYTPLGQALLCALFQIGGLGIMVLSAAMTVVAGRKLRLRTGSTAASALDAPSLADLKRILRAIALSTVILEAIGAAVLYLLFSYHRGSDLGNPSAPDMLGEAPSVLWAAVFHAVSAFCNAGFSLFHTGVRPFATSWPVCLTLIVLIVAGGLGFSVLDELWQRVRAIVARTRREKLSLHGRVVLLASAALVATVMLAFVVLEWSSALAGHALDERLLLALFQAVTPRTAGFNTVEIGDLRSATLMVLSLAMFIGASPGSTGGGVKTTTVAMLLAALRREVQRTEDVRLLGRSLPEAVIRRGTALFFLAALVVSASYLLLLVLEPTQRPMALSFEAFSAFGTVGLSTGVTENLSTAGKIVIILTMFVGRVGPLTMAALFAMSRRRPAYGLARERIMLG